MSSKIQIKLVMSCLHFNYGRARKILQMHRLIFYQQELREKFILRKCFLMKL